MTDFPEVYRRTTVLVGRVRARALAVQADGTLSRWRYRSASETLISDLWQIWNEFVRQMILLSCTGTVTRSDVTIPARAGNNSPLRIAYEAKHYAIARASGVVSKKPKPKPANKGRYQDPTWGDLDAIVDVVNGIAPTNAAALSTALGATALGLKHLQAVRNACFHKNEEAWKAIKDLERLHFSSSDTRDPSDLAWKAYLGKSNAAVFDWIDAVVTVTANATQ